MMDIKEPGDADTSPGQMNIQIKRNTFNIPQNLLFDTFVISLYQENIRIAEIHLNKTGRVVGGLCYISRRGLSRGTAKKLLQSSYAERLGLRKEAWKLSEI